MNNLLDELKENSTILCNTLSDADIFKSFHTVQAPPKSQPPNFFSFSYLDSFHQSPRKNADQVANSKGFSKLANESPKINSSRTENLASRGRTSDKKRINHMGFLSFEEISPNKPINVRGAIDKKSVHSQSDSFINYLNLFGAQTNDDPNCCSSEYQYNQPDQNAEDFLSFILNTKNDEIEDRGVCTYRIPRENSLGLLRNTPTELFIKDLLEISKQNIDFGDQLPGRILEESFDIKNTYDKAFTGKIFVSCINPELQNTQEYVYSIRSSHNYDYSDKRQFTIAPNSTLSFKIAVKLPQTKLANKILGKVQISADGLEGQLLTTLRAQSVLPKIFCPKQLYSTTMKRNFINVAINKEKPQEKKIPFKNESNLPVTLELGFYNPQNKDASLECSVYPKTLNIPANATATATILFQSSHDDSQLHNNRKSLTQKILYGKAKDSCLIYSFSLRVETF